jgi:hypothetical protein
LCVPALPRKLDLHAASIQDEHRGFPVQTTSTQSPQQGGILQAAFVMSRQVACLDGQMWPIHYVGMPVLICWGAGWRPTQLQSPDERREGQGGAPDSLQHRDICVCLVHEALVITTCSTRHVASTRAAPASSAAGVWSASGWHSTAAANIRLRGHTSSVPWPIFTHLGAAAATRNREVQLLQETWQMEVASSSTTGQQVLTHDSDEHLRDELGPILVQLSHEGQHGSGQLLLVLPQDCSSTAHVPAATAVSQLRVGLFGLLQRV